MKLKGLTVTPYAGEYLEGIRYLKDIKGNKLILFLGSSFSNLPLTNMRSFLLQVRNVMGKSP